MITIVLVDDHKIVREGLASILSEQPDVEVIAQAGNGRDAIDLTNRLKPNVVIMDVSMPQMNGEEATRQIKILSPETRIIAFSMFEDNEIVQKMYRAGAECYVLKTAPCVNILAAIRNGKKRIQ